MFEHLKPIGARSALLQYNPVRKHFEKQDEMVRNPYRVNEGNIILARKVSIIVGKRCNSHGI